MRALRVVLALIGMVLWALSMLTPFMDSGYAVAIAITFLMFTSLATAWALFSGPTAYISLATVAFFGIGAYTAAVLAESVSWPMVLLVSGLVSAVVSLIVGLSTLRLRGVYFVIFTFGLSELLRQLVTWYETVVSGSLGRFLFLDITQGQIVWQLGTLTALVFLIGWLMYRSRLGMALRMIGDDETVAIHSGVNTTFAKLAAFVISSVLMALAGAIVAPRWTYIDPNIAFNPVVSFQVLIMALLGGATRLVGPLLGVIPLVVLFEYLSGNFPNYFSILLGITFMVIVYFVPRGVFGLLERIIRREGSARVDTEAA
ncbi:MAG TPA: branched-chain amino acid ABC transporter permease [Burkholderiaceae bacterium]|nr:branched-chain amino acid ABC transporter permease [Burkholderiaceae bacterium]